MAVLDITKVAQSLISQLEGEQQKIKWLAQGVAMLHDKLVEENEKLLNGNAIEHSSTGSSETAETAIVPQAESI